jgi:hypothetical protein
VLKGMGDLLLSPGVLSSILNEMVCNPPVYSQEKKISLLFKEKNQSYIVS